jgi:hypothetical protein
MDDDSHSLVQFHKRYVKGTAKKSPVPERVMHLATLTKAVIASNLFSNCNLKVYISTFTLKHMFDKRPAEEFEVLLCSLGHIVTYPDRIYDNKNSKRGSIAFSKRIKNFVYFVPVEPVVMQKNEPIKLFIVSGFRTDEDYLKNYKLLWSWKGGKPSS